MTACDIDPAADWREQGWCCRECAVLAHLESCRNHPEPETTGGTT